MALNELRLVLTVKDFDRATAFFRGALGLKQLAAFENEGGHAVLLHGGHATLEIFDEAQAPAIDRIEVGRRVAGPVITPWRDRNVRLEGPEGIQLTFFTPLGE